MQATPCFFTQVPGVAPSAQEPSGPQPAVAQHTPSAQKPVEQVEPEVHGLPRSAGATHAPASQANPALQSDVLVQLVRQLFLSALQA
jgi:hypothetical protein